MQRTDKERAPKQLLS